MRYITCEICGLKTCRVLDQKRMFMAKFPLNAERCKQWVKVTGKEDLAYVPIEKLHEIKYICGKHFRPKDFRRKNTRLRKNAVPSLLLTAEPLSDDILVGFPLHISDDYIIKNQQSCIEPSKSIKETDNLKIGTPESTRSASASPTIHNLEHDYCPANIETPRQEIAIGQNIEIYSMDKALKQPLDSSSTKMKYICIGPLSSLEKPRLISSVDAEETNTAPEYNIYQVCHVCLQSDNTAIIGPSLRATYYALSGAGAPLPVLCRKCLQLLVNADRFSADCVKGFEVIRKLMDKTMMLKKPPPTRIVGTPLLPRPRKIQLSVKLFTPDYYDECVIEEMKEEIIENVEEPFVEPQSDDFITESLPETYCDDEPNEIKTEEVKLEDVNDDDDDEGEDKFQKHYDIQKLSFEEQLTELWGKQHSQRYKQALFKCHFCFTPFSDERRYNVHMFSHSEEAGPKECKVCHKRFQSSKYLYSHRRRHEYKYRCKICPVVAYSNTANEHIKFHKGKLYSCEKCNAQYKGKSTYMFHMKSKHPDPKCACPYCGFSFANTLGLRAHHRITHCGYNKQVPPDGPSCENCLIQFISEDALNTHLKVSPQHMLQDGTNIDKSNPLKPRRPKSAIQRVRYEIRATQFEKPLPCEPCGVAFTALTEYLNHMRKFHPEEYKLNVDRKVPLICDVCGKILSNATYLRCHMLQHQGVQFKCSLCDRIYKSYCSLSVHRSTHSGKRHACKICSKTFSSAGNRFKHMCAVHGTKEHIRCCYCDKSFKVKEHMAQHMRHVHFKEPWPKRKRERIYKPKNNQDIVEQVKQEIDIDQEYIGQEYIEEKVIEQNDIQDEYILEKDVWDYVS